MEHLVPIAHSYVIPLLPLAGAVVAGFFCTGQRKRFAHWPIWISVFISAVLSIMLLAQFIQHHPEGEKSHVFGVVNHHQIKAAFFDLELAHPLVKRVQAVGFRRRSWPRSYD